MCYQYTYHHFCGHIDRKTTLRCHDAITGQSRKGLKHEQADSVCWDPIELIKLQPSLCETCDKLCEVSNWLSRAPHARFSLLRDWKRSIFLKDGSKVIDIDEHIAAKQESRPSLTSSISTLFGIDEDNMDIHQAEGFSPVHNIGMGESQFGSGSVKADPSTRKLEEYGSAHEQKEIDPSVNTAACESIEMQFWRRSHSDRSGEVLVTRSIGMRIDELKNRLEKLKNTWKWQNAIPFDEESQQV